MAHFRLTTRPLLGGRRAAVGAVAIVIGFTGYLPAQDHRVIGYDIARQTVDGGGQMQAAGEMYQLSATVGQPDAGISSGGDYQLSAAFWFPVPPGDFGEDGNVDLADYAEFQTCSMGPGGGEPTDECQCFDVDHSGTIDLADFAEIQISYTGA